MPKSTMREEAEWKLPVETPFPAVLVKVAERVIPYKDKNTGEDKTFTKWEWEFSISEGEYAGLSAWGDTEDRITTHVDNKARQWSESLTGKVYEIGEGLDTDDLLGLKCLITVENTIYTKKDGTKSYLCPVADVFPPDALGAAGVQSEQPPF